MARRPDKQEGFQRPFAGIKLVARTPAAASPPPPPPPAPLPPPRSSRRDADDATLFASAMAGVAPLDAGSHREPPALPPALPRVETDADAEALAELCDLVAGNGEIDVTATDEHVEGLAGGVDRRVLKRLRRGDFAMQDTLDLHGLTREPARLAVREFLLRNRNLGRRCVRVITGRGLNSRDQIPVLRQNLEVWLTRSGMAKHVLAFTSAPPHDGGTGAVYVLLRRRRR
jgi:DNA-nicking Smr family endonuclease